MPENPQDGAAIALVARMDALLLIDRDSRRRALSMEDRQLQRRQYTEDFGVSRTGIKDLFTRRSAYEKWVHKWKSILLLMLRICQRTRARILFFVPRSDGGRD